MSDIHLACTFDDGYAPHFAVLAASLAAAKGAERVVAHVLHDGDLSSDVSATLESFLERLGIELRVYRLSDSDSARVPPGRSYHRAIWYRIFFPSLVDQERALYLDADSVVLQSLAPLYSAPLAKDDFLAAIAQKVSSSDLNLVRLGLDVRGGYFNSGVLLMDLEVMRRERFTESVLHFAEEAAQDLVWPDQDTLNLAARDRWLKVHPKWNALAHLWLEPDDDSDGYSMLCREEARTSPAVVQFNGTVDVKPWYYRSLHPLAGVYRAYRAQTPWPLEELEGKNAVNAVLRRLPRSWQFAISRAKQALFRRVTQTDPD